MSTPVPERRPSPSPRPVQTPDPATTNLALHIAQRLQGWQATDVVVLDVSGPLVIADYFVIATVQSTRQAQALARELDLESKQERGRRRRNTGGLETEASNWVLLDFDDIVVHLFLPEAREYYALESLWADVPRVPVPAAAPIDDTPTERRQPALEGLDLLGLGLLQPKPPASQGPQSQSPHQP